jgi:hypothetical protein
MSAKGQAAAGFTPYAEVGAMAEGNGLVEPPKGRADGEVPALDLLDSGSVSRLRAFFELLDQWDQEAHDAQNM